jgi:hypothetical protein
MFCDGWATVEDIADTLVERVHLSPEEAQSVADEALKGTETLIGPATCLFTNRSVYGPRTAGGARACWRPASTPDS